MADFAALLKIYYPQDGYLIDWPDTSLWKEYLTDLHGEEVEVSDGTWECTIAPMCRMELIRQWGTKTYPSLLWYTAKTQVTAHSELECAALSGLPVPRKRVQKRVQLGKILTTK